MLDFYHVFLCSRHWYGDDIGFCLSVVHGVAVQKSLL